MSDPVTNAEIEDVLSSIRRLVSEDTRKFSRVKPDDPPPDRHRLVLTPSLRVPEISEPQQDARETWTDDGAPEEWTNGKSPAAAIDASAPPWSDPHATLYQAADGHATHEAGDDGGEPTGDDGDIGQTDVLAGLEIDAPQEATDAKMRDDGPGGPGAENDDEEASLEATVEALETAIGDTSDQWEPDGEGGDDYAGTPVQTLEWEDHEAGSAQEDATDPTAPENAWHDPGEDSRDRLTDGSGAAENAVGLDPLASEDTILDEESLRELVTEIVREELQGALGERITRNVRKLVRREIRRALTAQDLE